MNYNGIMPYAWICLFNMLKIMLAETNGADYYLHFINNLESVCTCFVLLVGNIKSLIHWLLYSLKMLL